VWYAHYEIGGVKGKQPPPLNGLQYKKDPSRQGSGVFIAHGNTGKNYEDLLPGVLVSSDTGSEGKESMVEMSSFPVANDCALLLRSVSSPTVDPSSSNFHRGMMMSTVPAVSQTEPTTNTSTAGPPSSSTMVNITPLGNDRAEGNFPNINPAMTSVMTSAPGNVQVMNVLDEPQASNTLEQFAMTDTGFLEGIPGGMFDWGKLWPSQ
jgi:hypothetical protein